MIKKILDADEIKQTLYSVIEDELGKQKIQTEITSDIKLSQKYIGLIMGRCIAALDSELNDDLDDYFYITIMTTLTTTFILCLQFVLFHQKEKSQSKTIYLLT